MAELAAGLPDPPDLVDWGLHCYCPEARRTPHGLIAQGDNGRILYVARAGATQDRLGATDAQLAALIESGLLERDGDRYVTSFPVIGARDMATLREDLARRADRLAEEIETPARTIAVALGRRGIARSAYAMVFGYGLDLLLWEPLKAGGLVPDTALTPQRPSWNGAFWAIHPPRPGSAGTNFLDCGDDLTLVMVWSDATTQALDGFAKTPGIREALRSLPDPDAVPATGGRSAAPAGMPWRLRLPDGRPGLPIVGAGGVLDDLARQVAAPVVDLLAGQDAEPFLGLVPTRDRAVATVVVAHELIWEVVDRLVERGACRRPSADDDLTSHMFLWRTSPGAASTTP